MRYTLLMHHRTPEAGELDPERIAETQAAFGRYARALTEAGVLVAGEVLREPAATTTITRRSGTLEVQDGPFAETREGLAGIFVIDVPDRDAALGWAEKCPGAGFGSIEVRPAATSIVGGTWTGA